MPLADTVRNASENMPATVDPDSFGPIDQERILTMLGLNPRDPKAHAVIAVAKRYHLDPVLGHISILPKSQNPYITRDGYLEIAHRSGHLDGMDVEGPTREGNSWFARVTVYRDDMTHAFTYPGWAPIQENGAMLAIARAERRALKRAFAVSAPAGFWDEDEGAPAAPLSAPQTPEPRASGMLARGDDPADAQRVEDVELPDMISRGQQTAMFAYFNALKIKDREQRLKVTNEIIAPDEVSTSDALTYAQAHKVLDALHKRAYSDSPQTPEEGEQDGQPSSDL